MRVKHYYQERMTANWYYFLINRLNRISCGCIQVVPQPDGDPTDPAAATD